MPFGESPANRAPRRARKPFRRAENDSSKRPWPSRLRRRRLLFHPRHNFVSRSITPSFEASALPRLPKVRSYLRSAQVGQLLEGDMTHRLAGSLQDSSRIIQVRTTRKPEGCVSRKYADVADAVRDDPFRRAIQQNNLRAHLEDVLMTRSHLLMDHFPKAQGKRLDAGIVPIEEFEQLAWRSRHATHWITFWRAASSVVRAGRP